MDDGLRRVRGIGPVRVDPNVVATHVDVHQVCLCCGWDSELIFSSWGEVDGKKVYSDPPTVPIGVNLFCVNPIHGWGTRLLSRGVSVRLVTLAQENMLNQLKEYLEDPDPEWVEAANYLIEKIPEVKFESDTPYRTIIR